MGRIVVDADIFIDMLRGIDAAVAFFEQYQAQLAVSVVTLTELLAGFRTAAEEKHILEIVSYLETIAVTDEIAIQAGYFRKKYGKTHGSGIIDCLIAATALSMKASVATRNRKHYPMMQHLLIPYQKS